MDTTVPPNPQTPDIPQEPPRGSVVRARSVYVIEERINLAAGGHAFQLLTAGFAHPSAANAQATVENMAGKVRWNDRLEAYERGDSSRLPLFRIVEVPLDTRGGVR